SISKFIFALQTIPNTISIVVSTQTNRDRIERRLMLSRWYHVFFALSISAPFLIAGSQSFIEVNGSIMTPDAYDLLAITLYTILAYVGHIAFRKRYAVSEALAFVLIMFIIYPIITYLIALFPNGPLKLMNAQAFGKYILIFIEIELMHPSWRMAPLLRYINRRHLPRMVGKYRYVRAKISLSKSLRRAARESRLNRTMSS
ncbi:hypothetical protein, partial [Deinococcus radiotolerans]|uniref:hypothetical protein n=1 Tax=Deinococcus radiotolerans TaxID=1309407 RepID=UPI00166C22AF